MLRVSFGPPCKGNVFQKRVPSLSIVLLQFPKWGGPFFALLFLTVIFCSNFDSLEAFDLALRPEVFCSNFHRFALRLASNFVSSYNPITF